MLNKFWEKAGEELASEWMKHLAPSFLFLGGALLAWITRYGWDRFNSSIKGVDASIGVAILIGGIFLLTLTTSIVQLLTLPVLRVLEGYWPSWLWRLRVSRTAQINNKVALWESEWNILTDKLGNNTLDSKAIERYIFLDSELNNYPVDIKKRMPTKLGNILRAAEEYPNRVYGLEINITWPRLWLTLSDNTQRELSKARRELNEATQLVIWGMLFFIWSIWAFWVLLASIVVISFGYINLITATKSYGQLLRSAYDLNRFGLYDELHWPLPDKPDTEDTHGKALTIYLKRNIALANVEFCHPKKE